MAGPITWRSLNSAGLMPADASRPLEVAGKFINNGFDIFNQAIKAQDEVVQQNWEAGKRNNTAEFMAALIKAKTPQELEAMQAAGGELDPTRYGAKINQDAVLKALDGRPELLQQRQLTRWSFEDTELGRKEEPIKQGALAKLYAGDVKGAMEWVKANEGKLRNPGEIYKLIETTRRDNVTWDQNQQRYLWAGEQHDMSKAAHADQLATNEHTRTTATAKLKIAQQQAAAAAAAAKASAGNKAIADLLTHTKDKVATLEKLGQLEKNRIGSTEGMNAVAEALTKQGKSKGEIESVMKDLSKIAQDPIASALTPGEAVRLVNQSTRSSALGLFSYGPSNLATLVEAHKKSPEFTTRYLQDKDLAKELLQRQNILDQLINRGQPAEKPAPSASEAAGQTAQAQTPTTGAAPGSVPPPPAATGTPEQALRAALPAANAAQAAAPGQTPAPAAAPVTAPLDRAALLERKKQEEVQMATTGRTQYSPEVQAYIAQEKQARQAEFDRQRDEMRLKELASAREKSANYNMSDAISRKMASEQSAPVAAEKPKPVAQAVPASPLTIPSTKNPTGPLPANAKAQTVNLAVSADGSATPTGNAPPLPKNISWDKPEKAVVPAKGFEVTKNSPTAFLTADFSLDDGDTLKVKGPGGKVITCRMAFVDTPETAKPRKGQPAQPGGDEAAALLKSMVQNQQLEVTVVRGASKESKNRQICQIKVAGKDLSLAMLEAGAGWLTKEFSGLQAPDDMVRAFSNAKRSGTGIFADPTVEEPYRYRKRFE